VLTSVAGTANYPYLDAPIDAIKRKAGNVVYYATDSFPSVTPQPGDIAVVFINSDSGENQDTVEGNNGDRNSAGLVSWHGGDALVQAAAEAYATVIVVVHTVGPIVVEPWIELASVKAVLFAHLPGQEGGDSLTDILFGDHSPSGHLPYSIPVAESDYPASVGIRGFELFQVQDTFSEGLYIDYRYLNKHQTAPRYAFGHGLSYTTFSWTNAAIRSVAPLTSLPPPRSPKAPTPVYSDTTPSPDEVAWPSGFSPIWRYLYPYLDDPQQSNSSGAFAYPTGYQTTPQPDPPSGGGLGGNDALWDIMHSINVTITNTGTVPGKAVAMLFVQYPADIAWDTPAIQLRAFEKTDTLAAGQSQTVALELRRKDVSVWDVVGQDWVVPSTTAPFTFWIGESSAGLTLACDSLGGECSGGRTPPV
jgi:hypothetical protein